LPVVEPILSTVVTSSNNITPTADKLSTEFHEVKAHFKDLNTPVETIDMRKVDQSQTDRQKTQNTTKKDPKIYLKTQQLAEFSKALTLHYLIFLGNKLMCYLAKHQINRSKLIEILANQNEVSWDKKA
jgi:hypothetical protein